MANTLSAKFQFDENQDYNMNKRYTIKILYGILKIIFFLPFKKQGIIYHKLPTTVSYHLFTNFKYYRWEASIYLDEWKLKINYKYLWMPSIMIYYEKCEIISQT